MGGCALAVFSVLYAAQFLNLGGWSADYNVTQWEKNRTRNLDLDYIYRLGPAGWPALHRAALDGARWEVWDPKFQENADVRLAASDQETAAPRTELNTEHWREFSLRAYLNRWTLDDKK